MICEGIVRCVSIILLKPLNNLWVQIGNRRSRAQAAEVLYRLSFSETHRESFVGYFKMLDRMIELCHLE